MSHILIQYRCKEYNSSELSQRNNLPSNIQFLNLQRSQCPGLRPRLDKRSGANRGRILSIRQNRSDRRSSFIQ
jgi:hypothetical protein